MLFLGVYPNPNPGIPPSPIPFLSFPPARPPSSPPKTHPHGDHVTLDTGVSCSFGGFLRPFLFPHDRSMQVQSVKPLLIVDDIRCLFKPHCRDLLLPLLLGPHFLG